MLSGRGLPQGIVIQLLISKMEVLYEDLLWITNDIKIINNFTIIIKMSIL